MTWPRVASSGRTAPDGWARSADVGTAATHIPVPAQLCGQTPHAREQTATVLRSVVPGEERFREAREIRRRQVGPGGAGLRGAGLAGSWAVTRMVWGPGWGWRGS